MTYLAEIESRVAGIPCIIGVTAYRAVRGTYSQAATSSMEYYGSIDECEWVVLDRRGRHAAWLERKVTQADVNRIETQIEYELAD